MKKTHSEVISILCKNVRNIALRLEAQTAGASRFGETLREQRGEPAQRTASAIQT